MLRHSPTHLPAWKAPPDISPAELENALVEGATGQACALRAGSLLEAYGSRGEECAAC
jgi:hypothetical protein